MQNDKHALSGLFRQLSGDGGKMSGRFHRLRWHREGIAGNERQERADGSSGVVA
jgi:hypothetical protein